MLLENLTIYQAKSYLHEILKKHNTETQKNEQETYFLQQIEYYVEQEVINNIRVRQKNIPGLKVLAHGKKAIWGGELTPGCSNCLDGSGLVPFRSVSSCNLNCKFCYYLDEKVTELIPAHYKLGSQLYTIDDIKMLIDKQGKKTKAITWVYFEPFMEFEKHPEIIKYIHDAGIHQHMYTNGTLCTEEQFKILQDRGLEEMRFDLAATHCSQKVLNTMKVARKYFNYLCIESPMYIDFYNSFLEHKNEILDIGVDQINFAELHLRKQHTDFMDEPIYRYKYGYVSPISSRQLTYNIIEIAEKEQWKNITINDCSNETKYYRSFLEHNQLGDNYWSAEMQLDPTWHLKAISYFEIFNNVCKHPNKMLPDGFQKKWEGLSNQFKETIKKNSLNIKCLVKERGNKELTFTPKNNKSIEFLKRNTEALLLTDFSLYQQYKRTVSELQQGIFFKEIGLAVPEYTKNTIYGESIDKQVSSLGLHLEFEFAPDEVKIPITKLNPEIKKRFITNDQNTEAEITCIPYANIFEERIEYIPAQEINNLFSIPNVGHGETLTGAMNNGIYAALKNYVTYSIFKNKEHLPEIKHEHFIGSYTYNNLKEVEKHLNKTISVKDCSIGKGFPVFGLLVIDNLTGQFSFLLESNLDIEKAVDIMLTKLVDNEVIYTTEDHINSYPDGLYSKSQILQKHYCEILQNGSGHWPGYVCTGVVEPMHQGLLENKNLSENDDLNQLLLILKKHNKTLFVRNIGFLNDTPTVNVHIPSFSEIGHLWDDAYLEKINLYKTMLTVLNNLQEANTQQIEKLTHAISTINDLFPGQLKLKDQFLYIKGDEWDDVDINIFISMLFYRTKNWDKSMIFINKYLLLKEKMYQESPALSTDKNYLNAALKYISSKKKKKNTKYILRKLQNEFGANTAKEVINDFYDPENIFKHYALPSIFNNLENESYFPEVLKIVKKMHEKQKNAGIKQEELLQTITNKTCTLPL